MPSTLVILGLCHLAQLLPIVIGSFLPRSPDSYGPSHTVNMHRALGSQTLSPSNVTATLQLQEKIANISAFSEKFMTCFQPGQFNIPVANVDHCEFIINEVILRLPNPMQKQTWGFNDDSNFNLERQEYDQWPYKQCVISVSSIDHTAQGYFSPADVALISLNIIQKCVNNTKYPLGGTISIDTLEKGFYVVVGGKDLSRSAATATERSLPPGLNQRGTADHAATPLFLEKQDGNITDILGSEIAPVPVNCIEPGDPADRGPLDVNNCIVVAREVLAEPNTFIP